MELINILNCSFSLFAIVNIVGSIPLILNLKKVQHVSAKHSTIYSVLFMVVFLFFGKYLFQVFSINIEHFAIAASILLFFVSGKMMFGLHFEYEKTDTSLPDSSLYPLAFPMLAGPGTLAAIMSFRTEFGDFEILSAILINSVFIYLTIRASDWIGKKLPNEAIFIIEKIFGVFLMSIAIKMFILNILLIIK